MASISRSKSRKAIRKSRRSVKQHPSKSTVRQLLTTRNQLASETRRPEIEVRAVYQVCLKFALKAARMSARAAALEMGVSESTVSKWLSDDTTILVHKVHQSRKLWPHFLLHLYHRESAGGHLG